MSYPKSPCRDCNSVNREVCIKNCKLIADYREIQTFERGQKEHPLRGDSWGTGCRHVGTTPKHILDEGWPE